MTRTLLLAAVDTLETMLAKSVQLGAAELDDHRRDAIQLRRLLSAQNAEIGKLGEEVFSDPADLTEFRSEFSKMRSATAFHQASWPVVSIDLQHPDYLASLKSSRDANKQFIGWIRRVLAAP
jgi:hypothetical protein